MSKEIVTTLSEQKELDEAAELEWLDLLEDFVNLGEGDPFETTSVFP